MSVVRLVHEFRFEAAHQRQAGPLNGHANDSLGILEDGAAKFARIPIGAAIE